MTEILRDTSDSALKNVAARLRNGDVVAFPTETVYGLGANAGLARSVERVFGIKGRPSQDPLIVHCASFSQTKEYLSDELSDWQRSAHESLGRTFWPGPLTLILPCDSKLIVPAVSAQTGWVGLRCPSHPVARRFLELCDCPVAAPSANLFGHVSPTSAQHVYDDFPDVDNLWIVDGGACGFGIESTVVRLNSDGTVDILRRGGVGRDQILDCLQNSGLLPSDSLAEEHVRVVERYLNSEAQGAPLAAPGQLLVHYSPHVFTTMVSLSASSSSDTEENSLGQDRLRKTVVLDFNRQLQALSNLVGAYRDLSSCGDSTALAHDLFSALRWAEAVADSDPQWQIWLFNPRKSPALLCDEVFLAVADRIYRAAAGREMKITIKPGSDRVFV